MNDSTSAPGRTPAPGPTSTSMPDSPRPLPLELLVLVGTHCDPATLATLCRLSRTANDLLTPTLYRNLAVTRSNVERLFSGLPRRARRKKRVSRATREAQLEKIMAMHGAAFAGIQAEPPSVFTLNHARYPRQPVSEPETDDEEPPRREVGRAASAVWAEGEDDEVDEDGQDNDGKEDHAGGQEKDECSEDEDEDDTGAGPDADAAVTWERRRELFTHTRSITFVQVPPEAFVEDLAGVLDVKHEQHQEGYNWGIDTDDAQAAAAAGSGLFPSLTHLCFSLRVTTYFSNYISRDAPAGNDTEKVTTPWFAYVVSSASFGAPSEACFTLPTTTPDFATFAARWVRQIIGCAPEVMIRNPDWDSDSYLGSGSGSGSSSDSMIRISAAEAVQYYANYLWRDWSGLLVQDGWYCAVTECMPRSFARVTMHNATHVVPWRQNAMYRWDDDEKRDYTFFLRPDAATDDFDLGRYRLAERNVIVGLDAAQWPRLRADLEADPSLYGRTQSAAFVPVSAAEVAAEQAARAEHDAATSAAKAAAQTEAMRLAANDAVARDYIDLVTERAPELVPKLKPYRQGPEVMKIHTFAIMAGELQTEAQAKGVPRMAAFKAVHPALRAYNDAVDEHARLVQIAQTKGKLWDRLAEEIRRKRRMDKMPTAQERLRFFAYDDAPPCAVCGDKRAEERSLKDLIEWAREIRH